MAEANETNGGTEGRFKSKRLLLMIIIGVLVLALVAGTTAFFLMKKGDHADDEEDDAPDVEETRASKKDSKSDEPPVFVKLDTFTIKLQPAEQQATDSYLQTTPELRVLDATIGERVKQYMPEIRHRVLLILSGKKAADLSTPQGVEQLSVEIRKEINTIIGGPAPKKKTKKGQESAPEPPSDKARPDDPVQAVLFTSFIIQ